MKQPCRLWVLITPIYHLLLSTCTWRAHSCLSGGDLNVCCSYQLHPAEGGSTWWTGPTVGPEQEVHVAAGLDCRAQSAHVRLWAHLRGFVETKAAFIRVFPLLAVTHSELQASEPLWALGTYSAFQEGFSVKWPWRAGWVLKTVLQSFLYYLFY